MNRGDRRRLLIALAVAVAVAVVVGIVVLIRPSSTTKPPTSGVASDVARTIPTDGAKLAAEVITPKGKARAPLIVMAAAWGSPATVYHSIGMEFAQSGYQVVAYAQRGFNGSTGQADFAGAGSQHDASAVITWALKHTNADPHKIGMFGMSYGAGIGLLAAAHDPRIKAVAALSTWTNLADTYVQDGTPATAALRTVIGNPDTGKNFDSTIQQLQTTLARRPTTIATAIAALSPSRSPDSYVKELNKNDPAILIANAYQDSLFDPAQLVPFFSALKTPKRLELAAGDHGSPERSALSGLQNATVDDVHSWFDHFLLGVANHIDQEPPIQLRDGATGELQQYQTWPQARKTDRRALPSPSATTAQSAQATTWRATIAAGTDTVATSGPMQLFVPASIYAPPRASMKAISASHAFVWSGPAEISGLGLVGTPSLQIGLGSSASTATVFLYLYDVDANGTGTLINMQPYTATHLVRGQTRYVTIAMQPMCWTVPTGHHLALVIDTVDPRYQSLTPSGSTVTVASSKKEPASFTAPSSG